MLPEELAERVIVRSAGTSAVEGGKASDNAITVAKEMGVDLSEHRSQKVKRDLVKEADIILALASNHKSYLESTFPEFRENVFLLKTFDRDRKDPSSPSIPDPLGKDLDFYRKVYTEIAEEIKRIFPRLIELIKGRLEGKGYLSGE